MSEEYSEYKNTRLNTLATAAFLVVIACLAIAVLDSSINEYAKGIVTFLLGRFSGYVDNVYSFEFGTTRGSKAKDDTITSLTGGASAQTEVNLKDNTAALKANTAATAAPANVIVTEGDPK